jgi:hypothetical protein
VRFGRAAFVLAALSGVVALSGCVYETREAVIEPEPRFETRCPRAAGASCDVRERACQVGRFLYMACLRETPVDAAQAPEVAIAATASRLPVPWPDESARLDLLGRGLALFGLQDPTVALGDAHSERASTMVAGWYDPERHAIVVVLPAGEAPSGDEANLTLAHEMVHAVQAVDGTLERRTPERGTDDTWLASSAMVEGEAVFYSWAIAAIQIERTLWNFGARSRGVLDDDLLDAADPYGLAASLFPYLSGAARVDAIWTGSPSLGAEAIGAFEPTTSTDVLLGVATESTPMRAPSARSDADSAAFTSLGAMGLDTAWLVHLGAAPAARDVAVRSVGEDRFGVYRHAGNRGLVAVWLIRERAAGTLRQALDPLRSVLGAAHLEYVESATGQRVAIWVVSEDADLRADYVGRARAAVAGDAAALDGAWTDSGFDFDFGAPGDEAQGRRARRMACATGFGRSPVDAPATRRH